MKIGYDEMSIYQELKFLNELININERSCYYSCDNIIKPFNNAVKNVEKYIKRLNKQINFDKVNIIELFNFINQGK